MDVVPKNAAGPKRRDLARTRAAILAAAKAAFSRHGYGQTGIRDIAAIAGVSSSLISRYFGSKAQLFETALLDAMLERELFEPGKAGFGQRFSKRLLDPDLNFELLAMSVFSMVDDEAREITTRITQEHIIATMVKWLGPPDAEARAIKMLMLGTGFTIYARQLPLSSRPAILLEMHEWVARELQAIVDMKESSFS